MLEETSDHKRSVIMLAKKYRRALGVTATCMSIIMYVAYVPQIYHNLVSPHKGDYIQPLTAAINCTLWVLYAWFKSKRDRPLLFANLPGVILGILTTLTALIG